MKITEGVSTLTINKKEQKVLKDFFSALEYDYDNGLDYVYDILRAIAKNETEVFSDLVIEYTED